ncbi:TPA: hypothetical protein ACQ31I_004244, partial [Yersinia enterocolitica]
RVGLESPLFRHEKAARFGGYGVMLQSPDGAATIYRYCNYAADTNLIPFADDSSLSTRIFAVAAAVARASSLCHRVCMVVAWALYIPCYSSLISS